MRKRRSKPSAAYRSTLAYLDSEPSEYSQAMFDLRIGEAGQLGYRMEYFQMPRTLEELRKLSQKLWIQGIGGILLGPAQRIFPLKGFAMES